MNELFFSLILYIVISMGLISIAWIRTGMKRISDELILALFRYLVALTLTAIIFSLWILLSSNIIWDSFIFNFVNAIALVAIFALISGAARSVKAISDVYGFKAG